MKKLFVIAIAEENGEYFAIVDSLTDQKHATVADGKFKLLVLKMNKLLRVKARQERLLPMPQRNAVLAGRNNGHDVVLDAERN